MNKKTVWEILLVVGLTALFYFISFRGIIFDPGYVYHNWDNNMPPFSIQIRHLSDLSGNAWCSRCDMGTQGVWMGITRYFDIVILKWLSFLGGKFLGKFLYMFYAIIGGMGFWLIARKAKWGLYTTIVVIIVSQFNPKIYSSVVSGHWLQLGFMYSLFPWFILTLNRLLCVSSKWLFWMGVITTGVIGAFIVSSSPMGIVYFGIIVFLFLVSFCINKKWYRIIAAFIIGCVIITILHIFWIMPVKTISRETTASFKYSETAEDIIGRYTHFYHEFSPELQDAVIATNSVNDMGREYAYPVVNGVAEIIWKSAAYAIFLLIVLGAFAKSNWRQLKFFSLLCLISGIILFAGDKTLVGKFFFEEILTNVKVVFFLMARTNRWLFLYFIGFALSLGFAMDGIGKLKLNGKNLGSIKIVQIILFVVFAVYLYPYWDGSITAPKNDTSQTMSLMPQKVSAEENKLAKNLTEDRDDYRIAILPNFAGPAGPVPVPPRGTYSKNYMFFGKDSIGAGTIVGEEFLKFITNILYRESIYTSYIGKLYSLCSAKYIIKIKDEKYYTYYDFGYFERPENCHETLFYCGNILERFLGQQNDLVSEQNKKWEFDELNIYNNNDFLDRIRFVKEAYLVSGDMSLLVSLSELEGNFFRSNALFFNTDIDVASFERLSPFLRGIIVYNNLWTEFLLPFIPKDCWRGAVQAEMDDPNNWKFLKDVWHSELWFSGSVLNNGAVVSVKKAKIVFNLKDKGRYKLFACFGKEANTGGVLLCLNDKNIYSDNNAENNRRGFIWQDLGVLDLTGEDRLTFDVCEGTAIRGILVMPEDIYNKLSDKRREKVKAKNIYLINEAEAVSCDGVAISDNKGIIPLIEGNNGKVEVEYVNAENLPFDSETNRMICPKGDAAGEVVFRVGFNGVVNKCRLVFYPRLFNDTDGKTFVTCAYSIDGINYKEIFKINSNESNTWDGVYSREEKHELECNSNAVFIKFQLNKAQIYSLVNRPNLPMRIESAGDSADGVVRSWGQAVALPANFRIYVPSKGEYSISARMIGKKGNQVEMLESDSKSVFEINKDGASWMDMGSIKVDAEGEINIRMLSESNVMCDLLCMKMIHAQEDSYNNNLSSYSRINPACYNIEYKGSGDYLLLFSENYHNKWLLDSDGKLIEPIKVYGFMNAYPVTSGSNKNATLFFTYQPLREKYWKVSMSGWIVIAIFLVICILGYVFEKKG